jgi:hypothetical protein
MNQQVRFTCTALPVGKSGELPVDEYGYYTHPIGALNAYNSCQEWYRYEGARDLFEKSSSFMMRVKNGTLVGEYSHPKPAPGQSMDSYVERFMSIEETRISHHFSEIWLDFDSVKAPNGAPQITIMAKVKPQGPYGQALEGMLKNPKYNTCFSLRGITDDKLVANVNQRTLKRIVTFDAVGHSGMEVAKKFYSPSLESVQENTVVKKDFMKILRPEVSNMATESARTFGLELFQSLGWDVGGENTPSWAKW